MPEQSQDYLECPKCGLLHRTQDYWRECRDCDIALVPYKPKEYKESYGESDEAEWACREEREREIEQLNNDWLDTMYG